MDTEKNAQDTMNDNIDKEKTTSVDETKTVENEDTTSDATEVDSTTQEQDKKRKIRRGAEAAALLGVASIAIVNELYDSQAPYKPGGTCAQAWSVSEIIKIVSNLVFVLISFSFRYFINFGTLFNSRYFSKSI